VTILFVLEQQNVQKDIGDKALNVMFGIENIIRKQLISELST
jgi:hypothetical protein